ncbi:MAG: 7,8-dihydro-8-oxoguanine triphosphatase [Parcubacteria group bacterium Gr01-1014_56]|nr:MAG: 7,8-dihydro-8-oxoguanine triphosphatase [Parcubacteria group bacterium Gr01-1014_56]
MDESHVQVGVGLLVFKDGKVLMGKRIAKHGGGRYCGPGGHLEFGESIEECAIRETLEEAGIEIQNVRVICVHNLLVWEGKHYIDFGVAADWKSGELQNLEPTKRENWDWYDVNNLPQPLMEAEDDYFEAMKTGQIWQGTKRM